VRWKIALGVALLLATLAFEFVYLARAAACALAGFIFGFIAGAVT
jgi:hypothetical protein